MEQLFNSFPPIDKMAIAWNGISSIFPFFAGFFFSLILAILLTIVGFLSLASSSHKNEREAKSIDLKYHLIIGWGIFGTFLVLGGFLFLVSYTSAEVPYEEKSAYLLDIKIYQDWYVENAPLIDEKLTSREFEYLDLNYDVQNSLSAKEELYLKAIGFKSKDVVVVDITDRQGKHALAYVKVVGGVKDKKDGLLVLKSTLEFGEEYAFGDGILYGTLYVN